MHFRTNDGHPLHGRSGPFESLEVGRNEKIFRRACSALSVVGRNFSGADTPAFAHHQRTTNMHRRRFRVPPNMTKGPRADQKVADTRPARALRPATAEYRDHVGLLSSARLLAGAGMQIVTELTDKRPSLPRRGLRAWYLAELLGLPRIGRHRRTQPAKVANGDGRARPARAERQSPRPLIGLRSLVVDL